MDDRIVIFPTALLNEFFKICEWMDISDFKVLLNVVLVSGNFDDIDCVAVKFGPIPTVSQVFDISCVLFSQRIQEI
jgi:hypothetical protein